MPSQWIDNMENTYFIMQDDAHGHRMYLTVDKGLTYVLSEAEPFLEHEAQIFTEMRNGYYYLSSEEAYGSVTMKEVVNQ